jgi:glutamate---cysteine ligase / carboxylate-amine ligase
MTLEFSGSDGATIGVEVELQIIDPVTMDLTPRAQEVLMLCEQRGISHVKAEIHQSMLEIDTKVSTDVKDCRKCLESTLAGLYTVVEDLGLLLSTSGTHPFQKWPERLIFPNTRYMLLQKKFRWLVKRMNVYGLHVHIGVSDGEKAMALSRAMYRFLPHLLALSANSPFWHGEDTGMQACRPSIMESFPTGGLPPYLENWSQFELYFDTMAHAGAIKSPKDLYWYIRPNIEFGTIEFRICDAGNSVQEIMAIVAFIQNLVEMVDRDSLRWKWDQRQHWAATENHWIAARDGLNGVITTGSNGVKKQIAEEVYWLIDELAPIARSLNNYDELLYLKTILKQGNGAMRQREVFKETRDLSQVVKMCAEECRSNCFSLLATQR